MAVGKMTTNWLSKVQPGTGSPSERLRRSLLSYLRGGKISVIEAATIGGVTRQAVEKWCRQDGINVKRARHREFLRLMARIRGEVWSVKPKPRRGQRGKGEWTYHGKDELVPRKRT